MKSFSIRSFITSQGLLILIIILAAFLRFYQLGKNPPSLNWDEASNAYNAYSILKTGHDEYGKFFPLTFRSFGDYNLALSVYPLVPSIALFGLNEFAVRFPSALFGVFTVFITYFLTIKLSNNKITAIFASFLLAISPWHLQFSRYDHEANFMLFFSILGLTIFLYSFRNYFLLLLSALSFALALNTYHGAKIWIPLFLLLIIYWFRKELFSQKIKLIPVVLILFFGTLPLLLNFKNSLIRGQSVGIINKDNPLNHFLSGYLSHFSPNFLFTTPDLISRHSVQGVGELYFFELPFLILGFIYLLSQKSKNKFLFSWLLIAPIPAALALPVPHALRSITFLPLWSIISASGLTLLINSKIKKVFKVSLFLILSLVGIYNFLTYLHLYYFHYPKEKAPDWQYGYKEMVNYVDGIKDSYQSIAISNFYGRPYIFVLLYSKYDPKKYQQMSQNKEHFDKYEFFGSSWAKTKEGKALVVTPHWQAHPTKVLKNIYSTNGDLVFTISETQ